MSDDALRPPEALTTIREAAVESDEKTGTSRILAMPGDAPFIGQGEATHGTQEFYTWRACNTRALIEEAGFNASPLKATGRMRIR